MLYLTSRNNLMADAFFIWEMQLMFASLHGRDSDMLSFQAQLQTPDRHGFTRLGFHEPDDRVSCPRMTTAEFLINLNKFVTKYPTGNYGAVTHMFLYAENLVRLDLDNRIGWIVLDDVAADLDKAAWQLLQQLSDIPLLDHWQHTVLAELASDGSLLRFPAGIHEQYAAVGVQAVKIEVPENFDVRLTGLLQGGRLRP